MPMRREEKEAGNSPQEDKTRQAVWVRQKHDSSLSKPFDIYLLGSWEYRPRQWTPLAVVVNEEAFAGYSSAYLHCVCELKRLGPQVWSNGLSSSICLPMARLRPSWLFRLDDSPLATPRTPSSGNAPPRPPSRKPSRHQPLPTYRPIRSCRHMRLLHRRLLLGDCGRAKVCRS